MSEGLIFNLILGIWSFLLPVGMGVSDLHDIHVSKCEIQLNEETSSLEVATQIYLDDLQSILSKHGADNLHLCTDRESKDADTYLKAYLEQKLQISADGKSLTHHFVGKEPSEDQIVVWCYIELKVPAGFEALKVRYDVLMDLYDDQKNIVNIKARGKNGFMLFNSRHFEETIQYK